VSSATKRVEKLEAGLTPKQAMLLWLQEVNSFGSVEDYVRHLKTQPESAWPIPRLTDQVADAVKQTLKGQPREDINRAVYRAYKDVLFLFYLHMQVNGNLLSENRYYWTQGMLLTTGLELLLREQALDRQMRLNRIRVAREMPYPLDSDAVAAVEAAKLHHVMTWEDLNDGGDLGQWLVETFVANGKTALPDGAYGLISETKHLYSKVPTEAEVKELFQDAESFQKFLAGEDYSYGLADVPDA